MTGADIQYISNEGGGLTAVIVPISLWHEIESERETAYLLKSEAMKRGLLQAKQRQQGLSLDQAVQELGI
jgi:PHD/YefM family antitoxin component YafN of YafNO toxin-antitoxin module